MLHQQHWNWLEKSIVYVSAIRLFLIDNQKMCASTIEQGRIKNISSVRPPVLDIYAMKLAYI